MYFSLCLLNIKSHHKLLFKDYKWVNILKGVCQKKIQDI